MAKSAACFALSWQVTRSSTSIPSAPIDPTQYVPTTPSNTSEQHMMYSASPIGAGRPRRLELELFPWWQPLRLYIPCPIPRKWAEQWIGLLCQSSIANHIQASFTRMSCSNSNCLHLWPWWSLWRARRGTALFWCQHFVWWWLGTGTRSVHGYGPDRYKDRVYIW